MQQELQDHQHRAERIEKLIQEVASFPDAHARAITEELIQTLLDMYGEGLAHILEITAHNETSGQNLIGEFVQDELISSLLLLHGLHPIDIETRIARALLGIRSYLESHGGNVGLIKVENGIAYLRLESSGNGNGFSSSAFVLQQAIEDAVYKAVPDLDGIRVEGISDSQHRTGMPVTFIPRRSHKENIHARE